MPKRNPYSRWRRLPPVFRSGEFRIPGPRDEPQRIILYLKGAILDEAERLADQAGAGSLQDYCADLLAQAVGIERVKRQVAEVEAKRGALEGFQEIAGDAAYLAEWHERSGSQEHPAARLPADADGNAHTDTHADAAESLPPAGLTVLLDPPISLPEPPESVDVDDGPVQETQAPNDSESTGPSEPPRIRIERTHSPIGLVIKERIVTEVLSGTPTEILLRHIGPGDDDPYGFLPVLRRGQPVPPEKARELLAALHAIEAEYRTADRLDRRLAYNLHRLALESQVLLTEAWPGVFDEQTVAAIRACQERVERILSGQDIRYYQGDQPDSAEGRP